MSYTCYAVAGKVLDAAGNGLAERTLRLTDSAGTVLARLTTDRFGFYRADNLARGSYRVELLDGERVVAVREVTVTDGFLFDQDIQL